jgi:hypothetical protein
MTIATSMTNSAGIMTLMAFSMPECRPRADINTVAAIKAVNQGNNDPGLPLSSSKIRVAPAASTCCNCPAAILNA